LFGKRNAALISNDARRLVRQLLTWANRSKPDRRNFEADSDWIDGHVYRPADATSFDPIHKHWPDQADLGWMETTETLVI
jgi:hypothetical protein